MAGSRTSAAKDAPQSQKATQRKTDFRAADALRQSETLSPGAALQALRFGARFTPEQAAALSHTVGNRALEELLSVRNGPELLQRPLPMGDLQTPPLSIPDSAPEAPVMTAFPVWDGAEESNGETLTSVDADGAVTSANADGGTVVSMNAGDAVS